MSIMRSFLRRLSSLLLAAVITAGGIPAVNAFAAQTATGAATDSETSDELRQRLSDALEKSASMPIMECFAPIGGSQDRSVIIFEGVYYDKSENMYCETITHVEDSTDKVLYSAINYFDVDEGIYYTETPEGGYRFSFGEISDTMYDYLSLGFYLEYVPKGEYALEEKRSILLPNGNTVECDVITVTKEVEERFVPFNGTFAGKHLVLGDAGSNDSTAVDGVFGYDVIGDTKTLKDEYLIGEDGLLYSVDRVSVDYGTEHSMAHVFCYPDAKMTIPDAIREHALINADVVVKDGGIVYVSHYIEDKPSLAVCDYTKATPRKVTIPSKVKILGKKYKVDMVGVAAFAEMNRLKSITLPKSVDYIGKMAFVECNSLKNVVIKNKKLKNKLLKKEAYRDRVCIDLDMIDR